PRARSSCVSVIAWIAGPPMLRRAMIRVIRVGCGDGSLMAVIVVVDTGPVPAGEPMAKTTVVIPAWDGYAGAPLRAALRSVLDQAVPMRVLVVDNASLSELTGTGGVDVVRSERRLTVGAARNLGLAAVTTPYVVFWDADDVMLPGTLAFLQARIE